MIAAGAACAHFPSCQGLARQATPAKPRDRCSRRIGEHIEKVARGVEQSRCEGFHSDRPHKQVQPDFRKLRAAIMLTPSHLPVQPKHQWQSARNEEQVVEMAVQER